MSSHTASVGGYIPAAAMKGRKDATNDFRIPLSPEALAVLEQARRHARDGFMFPSVKKGVISDATMARLMERAGMEARPHGFRSSLRDWIAEATDTPNDIADRSNRPRYPSILQRDRAGASRGLRGSWQAKFQPANFGISNRTTLSGEY